MSTNAKFLPNDPQSISLNAAASGTGTVIPMNSCRQINWIVESSAGVSAGVVKIECAAAADYPGTWFELDSLDFSTIGASAAVGGSFPHPPGGFVRARIVAPGNITGGTVTARINGLLG